MIDAHLAELLNDPSKIARTATAQSKAKRQVQAKRGRFAKNMANLHHLPHSGKFPTKYKYG